MEKPRLKMEEIRVGKTTRGGTSGDGKGNSPPRNKARLGTLNLKGSWQERKRKTKK